MPVVIDNRPMFREAREIYGRFETLYDSFRWHQANGKGMNKATLGILEKFAYDAFKIHPDIRETNEFRGLNEKLSELIEKGILKLKEKEISPFDDATKNVFWKNFSEYVKNSLK